MINIFTTLFMALFSYTAICAPVPQEDLDRLNQRLAFLDTPKLTIRVASAEKDPATNRLTKLATIVTAQSIPIHLSLEKMNDWQVRLEGELKEYTPRALPTNQQLLGSIALFKALTHRINQHDRYDADFQHAIRLAATRMSFTMQPTSRASGLLDFLTIEASIPRRSGALTGSLMALLNYKKELDELVVHLMKMEEV